MNLHFIMFSVWELWSFLDTHHWNVSGKENTWYQILTHLIWSQFLAWPLIQPRMTMTSCHLWINTYIPVTFKELFFDELSAAWSKCMFKFVITYLISESVAILSKHYFMHITYSFCIIFFSIFKMSFDKCRKGSSNRKKWFRSY